LLDLDVLAQRYVTGETDARQAFAARYAAVVTEAVRCDGCHVKVGAPTRARQLLGAAADLADTLGARNGLGVETEAVRRLQHYALATTDACNALSVMEERYNREMTRYQERGAELVIGRVRVLEVVVVLAMALVVAMAIWLTRNLSHPVQRLIEAAQRIGEGDLGYRVALPHDPGLARLAQQFNEMAAKVEGRVREGERELLLERTIASQEDERKRVARELHDEVGQSLAALLLEARSGGAMAFSTGHPAIETGLTALLERVRRLAWDLRPSILGDHGLDAALRRHLEESAAHAGIAIDYQGVADAHAAPRLPEAIELVVYRVAQEAVYNAIRHGKAKRISVVLLQATALVTLLIEDDGVGFDVAAVRRQGGSHCLGLLGMEERVTLAGGEIVIESSAGHGCSIRARIPVEKKS
jgi:signal transduction histidine kinase